MQVTNTQTTVSAREAAQLLGIRLDAVYGLIWAARLTALKRDGRWLVDRAAVDERVKARAKTTCDATSMRVGGELRPGNHQR